MLGQLCLLEDINFGRSLAVLLMLGPLCLLAYINFVWVSFTSGKFRTLTVYMIMDILTHVVFCHMLEDPDTSVPRPSHGSQDETEP
jgi:hypothetical protein